MFELPKLNFHYKDLEPYIDALTLETHYTKHHQNYCNNLNKALVDYPQYQAYTIERLLTEVNSFPKEITQAVINSGGGYYNHNLYWENLTPNAEDLLDGPLLTKLNLAFGSLADFQKLFTDSATKLFGSGWTWLAQTKSGELKIVNTANQDCPITLELTPLLALDVWEHAYYLKYQNRRVDYIQNWWKLVDWKVVSGRLASLPL